MASDVAFAGSVPANYDRYMGPAMFDPYGREAAARITLRPSMRVLELAAGTGRSTIPLLARLPADGHIVATDLNDDMLDIARSKISDERVTFQVADAQELPFPDSSFDDVFCLFGIMFLPDKLKAVQEAYRVLKPHRQFFYMVWGTLEANPGSGLMHDYLQEAFPDDPPQFLNVPFGFHGEAENRNLMAAGRFTHVHVERIPMTLEAESAEQLARGLATGSPLAGALAERGVADLNSFASKCAERLANQFGDRPFHCPMEAVAVWGEKE